MAYLDLAQWIAQMEGFNTPGTIAARNNNPGNLRYDPTQIGQENTVNGKFATFATPEDGWAALQRYIENKAASDVTLRQFIYTYAPPVENDTTNYLNYLSSKLGIGADSPLSVLGSGSYGTDNADSSGISDISVPNPMGDEGFGLMPVLLGVGVIGLIAVVFSR